MDDRQVARDALTNGREALAMCSAAMSSHPDLATGLESCAALLRATHRAEQAVKLETRAKAIRARHTQDNPVE